MGQRINYVQQSPDLFKKLLELSTMMKGTAIGLELTDLVTIRASLMNGCTFCLDMHVKEAKIHGERELRLYHIPVWRESPLFSPRERAALEWTEAVTELPGQGVSDDVYDRVRKEFSEKELSDLTFSILIINAWNRLAVSFRPEPGSVDSIYGLEKAGLG
ncbi:MAG: carboxymuconolactone decarboxylase family protein [Leptospirales bacterium]